MKRFEILAVSAVLAAAFAVSAAPARAQVDTSGSIVVKKNPPKKMWLKAEVVHADDKSIIVREQNKALNIHTFTYSPIVKTWMEKIQNQGGYQTGDKVKIQYETGQTVALRIIGQPSKPI
jgi:opacity protein-like surface antigen